MRIGLIDVDGRSYPNLPLMKLSAWHKARGDSVEWYSPMFSGHMDRVYMSKVFSFSPDYEYFIDADEVVRGGERVLHRSEKWQGMLPEGAGPGSAGGDRAHLSGLQHLPGADQGHRLRLPDPGLSARL